MRILFLILFFPCLLLPQVDTLNYVKAKPLICQVVEDMPILIGGLDSLHQKLIYPQVAIKNNIEGKVYVLVTIDTLGSPCCAKILRGIGFGCDQEAIRVVSSAKYLPGSIRKKPIAVKLTIPITFKLPKN